MNLGPAEWMIIAVLLGLPLVAIVTIVGVVVGSRSNKQTADYPPSWAPPPTTPPPPPGPGVAPGTAPPPPPPTDGSPPTA